MSQVQLQVQLLPNLDTTALKNLLAMLDKTLSANSSKFNPVDVAGMKKEIDNATKGIQQFETAVVETKKGINQVNQELAQSGKSAELFSKAFQFNQLQQAVGTLAGTLSDLSSPFVELDKQVKNIGTLGVENFEDFAQGALDLSKKIPDNAATIANATYNAISAGLTGTQEEILGFVETAGKVAVAGVSDTNTAVNALTSVLNAYKLETSQAGSVSDTFFAAIKLGKTSFAEMSAGLANVIPAASAAGVSFQEVSGFIAQMTSLGVPTAQATTQIRAALIEVQKPGAELAKVMGNVSVEINGTKQALTSANIGQVLKQQGLAATLQQIEQASGQMGKSLTQVFSSSEASSAALLVTGTNAERMNETLAKVASEVANNAATGAYEVAANGIEVRTKIFMNNITALFSSAFSFLGEGANVAIGSIAQLAPVLTTLSSVKNIFPASAAGNIKTFALTILNTLVPGLITTNAATGALAINTGAMTAAQIASAAGAKIMAAAQALLNATFVANPIGAVILALVALGAILYALYNNFEGFRNVVDTVFKAVSAYVMFFVDIYVGAFNGLKVAFDETVKYLKAGANALGALLSGKNPLDAFSDSIKTDELEEKLGKVKNTIEKGLGESVKIKAELEKTENFEKQISELQNTQAKIKVLTELDNKTPEQEKELEALTKKAQNLSNSIGQVAKGAVTETKGAIDANGKYVESLSINVEKAKEFAKAQKEGNNKSLVANQKEVSSALITQSKLYEEQKKKLDEMAKKAVELKSAGKNDEYAKQVKDIEEFGKEVDKNKAGLVDSFTKAVQGGTATDNAQKKVGQTLGLNTAQVKQMADTQKAVTAETDKTTAAAKSLGDAYKEAAKQQNDTLEKSKSEITAIRSKLNNTKNITKEEKAQLELQLKAAKETAKQAQQAVILNKKETARTEKDYSTEIKTAEVKKVTAIELYNRAKEELQAKFDILQLDKEMALLQSGRSKNIFDEIQTENEKKKLIEDQLRILKEQFQVGNDGKIGLKLNKEEFKKAEEDYTKQLNDLNKALKQNEITTLTLNTKLQTEDIDKAKAELSKATKDTEYNISIGLATNEDLLNSVRNQLAPIATEVQKYEKLIADAQLLPDDNNKLASIKDAQDNLNKLTTERTELLRKSKDIEIKINEDKLANTLRVLDKEEQALKESNERQKNLITQIVENSKESALASFATEKEKQIAKLEEIYNKETELEKQRADNNKTQFDKLTASFNKGRLTEEEYYRQEFELRAQSAANDEKEAKRKEQLEANKLRVAQEAKAKELIATQIANGQLLELQRTQLIEELKIQQQKLNAELATANARGDVDGAIKIQESLDKVSTTLNEKGDLITNYAKVLQGDVTETLSSLFNGDPEQAKEGFRAVFGIVAGALKQYATATIATLILGDLNKLAPLGLGALVFLPLITAGVNAAVNGLLNPILSGLTSFSTGGRVDSPTMAIVGDASKSRAGRDSEWIFRDDQIQLMLGMVANKFYLGIDKLYNDIKNDNFRLYDLIKESNSLSNFAINEQGQLIELQNEIIRKTLTNAVNIPLAQLDVKVLQLVEYETAKQKLNTNVDVDFGSLRAEVRSLKSALTGSNLSENVININNQVNNDNVIATIEIANQQVTSRLDILSDKLSTINNTVSNLQLSISQNDIYRANKTVELNRLSRART